MIDGATSKMVLDWRLGHGSLTRNGHERHQVSGRIPITREQAHLDEFGWS